MNQPKLPLLESTCKPITRRSLLQGASAAALVGIIGNTSSARTADTAPSSNAAPRPAEKSKSFPDKFLWGCATAGHQVEGNNTNSDLWTLEHLPQTIFKEPSGDACDHYHLYPQDIQHVGRSWLQHLSLFPRVGAH